MKTRIFSDISDFPFQKLLHGFLRRIFPQGICPGMSSWILLGIPLYFFYKILGEIFTKIPENNVAGFFSEFLSLFKILPQVFFRKYSRNSLRVFQMFIWVWLQGFLNKFPHEFSQRFLPVVYSEVLNLSLFGVTFSLGQNWLLSSVFC